jgi:dihydropteroate synthase
MNSFLRCGRFELSLERPLIMGIVNATPDSFSEGPQHADPDAIIAHARRLLQEGADLIDIGGESTRPGAQPVDAEEELRRILPIIEALRGAGVPLSVDTFKPQVMRRVIDAGVDMINDIYAFRKEGALQAVAGSQCALCVMHMQGEPQTMQQAPSYGDVVAEVTAFLDDRVHALLRAGVGTDRMVLDPGFGFGKTAQQNYALLRNLNALGPFGYPWLVGVSRKSMIGHITGREPAQRIAGSIAAALAGLERGANILRVHDVAETVDAVKVWRAVEHGVVE